MMSDIPASNTVRNASERLADCALELSSNGEIDLSSSEDEDEVYE